MITEQDLQNRFTYHAPKNDQIQIYKNIRQMGLDFAMYLIDNVPDGREQSLAITHLEEIVMWANAGIARGR